MKKSREVFIYVLVNIIIASAAAIAGSIIFNSQAIEWTAISILGVLMINGIFQIVGITSKKIVKGIINTILIILAGALIGMLYIVPWWGYAIIILVSAVFISVFVLGFTGHEKKKKDN